MILRPIAASEQVTPNGDLASEIHNPLLTIHKAASGYLEAWAAIARTQTVSAGDFLLITQPDHARLAGELAAQFRAAFLPETSTVIGEIIGVHDAGWLQFPPETDYSVSPSLTETGRPRSFIHVPLLDSIKAWQGSIRTAANVSPLGEYMVSGHFCRLATGRLQSGADDAKTQAALRKFASKEQDRQSQLEPTLRRSHRGMPGPQEYVDLLQFCDALSLYLCCGASDAVEFPQRFGGERLRIKFENGVYTTTPSLFTHGAEPSRGALRFHIAARSFSQNKTMRLEIRIR